MSVHEFNHTSGIHNDSPLIQRGQDLLASLAFQPVTTAGITRDRSEYYLNITYPPLQTLPEITEVEAYPPDQAGSNLEGAYFVGIDFCSGRCTFCHYFTRPNPPAELVDTYIDALTGELRLLADYYSSMKATSLYIGGGTPSYLTPRQIDQLFEAIHANIDISNEVEVSFEMHPSDVDSDRLDALRSAGVNRISLGVQTFNDDILKGVNRRHTGAQAIESFKFIDTHGFPNVNIDLMYGLRGQTCLLWEEDLNSIAQLQPASITTYYQRIREGTPDFVIWKRHPDRFPTDEELSLMRAMAMVKFVEDLGYEQDPVDWFIRERRFRHQYQYDNWQTADQTPLTGLGPAAYSYRHGLTVFNINDINTYIEMVNQNQLPVWRGIRLTDEERMRRTMFLGIKMGIDRSRFLETYGIDVTQVFAPVLQRLTALGLVEITDQDVHLSDLGSFFGDEVGQCFISSEIVDKMSKIDSSLISTTSSKLNR